MGSFTFSLPLFNSPNNISLETCLELIYNKKISGQLFAKNIETREEFLTTPLATTKTSPYYFTLNNTHLKYYKQRDKMVGDYIYCLEIPLENGQEVSGLSSEQGIILVCSPVNFFKKDIPNDKSTVIIPLYDSEPAERQMVIRRNADNNLILYQTNLLYGEPALNFSLKFHPYRGAFLLQKLGESIDTPKDYVADLKKAGLEEGEEGWYDPNESVKVYVKDTVEAYKYFLSE